MSALRARSSPVLILRGAPELKHVLMGPGARVQFPGSALPEKLNFALQEPAIMGFKPVIPAADGVHAFLANLSIYFISFYLGIVFDGK